MKSITVINKALLFAGIAAFALSSCDKIPDDFNTDPLPDPGPDIQITQPVADYTTIVPESDWATIAGDTYDMGRAPSTSTTDGQLANQSPIHSVTLKGFKIMTKEVTVAQYKAFVAANPQVPMPEEPFWGWTRYGDREDYPIVGITWKQADAFARWLGGRLPTEAEWEYAARVPNDPAGNLLFSAQGDGNAKTAGWIYDNSTADIKTVVNKWGETVTFSGWMAHQVASMSSGKNLFGIYDMCGNAMEWCSDWYGENYYSECGASVENPQGPSSGTYKILRGGSWYSPQYMSNVYVRLYMAPGTCSDQIGFRVVMDL